MNTWFRHCYARLLIDNHITEDDPSFMTAFDPERYVARVKQAGIEAAMVYACCHNGNCYYPTRVGHMHANLKGRDIFGETVGLLRKAGIVPIAYYTSIFHNHSARTHPFWRITSAAGAQREGRYWWSCPNSDEYRAFARRQIGEVVAYDVDGVFNDMTFWPAVCACPSCREKHLAETGREIPAKVDWANPGWIAFQRFRERSMASFAQEMTDAAKSVRDITVTHQTSTIIHGWLAGYTLGIAEACDYTSGDFYGGKYQHSLGAKVLAAASRHQPYEFMTSRCVNLGDHTSMKSEAQMTAEAATTLANAGAYFFIDAINPDGTLEADVYDRLGSVSRRLAPFTARLKEHVPSIVADKALYFSTAAFVDESQTAPIMAPAGGKPALDELMGTAVALARAHIPFRVVTSGQKSFEGLNAIVMNNIRFTAREENERIREFVRNGGTLIATGLTSLCEPDGKTTGDFGLADVFGVSYAGRKASRFHYLAFAGERRFVSCNVPAPLVTPKGAQVVARICQPHFDPDAERYASIHSNPPGQVTEFAGLAVHAFGRGRCVYLASPVLSLQQDAQQSFAAWLFREYSPSAILVETNAPPVVEITLLGSSTRRAFLACFVNYQADLPNVPVRDITARFRLPGPASPTSVTRVSDGAAMRPELVDGLLEIRLPTVETLEMVDVQCGQEGRP